jgi:hypothetical protein
MYLRWSATKMKLVEKENSVKMFLCTLDGSLISRNISSFVSPQVSFLRPINHLMYIKCYYYVSPRARMSEWLMLDECINYKLIQFENNYTIQNKILTEQT